LPAAFCDKLSILVLLFVVAATLKKIKPLPSGNGFGIELILSFPYAGIAQIRFKGCNLRLKKPPLTNMKSIEIIVYMYVNVKYNLKLHKQSNSTIAGFRYNKIEECAFRLAI